MIHSCVRIRPKFDTQSEQAANVSCTTSRVSGRDVRRRGIDQGDCARPAACESYVEPHGTVFAITTAACLLPLPTRPAGLVSGAVNAGAHHRQARLQQPNEGQG
jgi:hypothetical protein